MKTFISFVIVAALIDGGYLLIRSKKHISNTGNQATSTSTVSENVSGETRTPDINITSPREGESVSTPLTLSGQARGNWFFEASAPVTLTDGNGRVIAESHISSVGDWMTTNFVPFTGTISWSSISTGTTTAYIIFKNDNPSGNPSLDKSVRIPVTLVR